DSSRPSRWTRSQRWEAGEGQGAAGAGAVGGGGGGRGERAGGGGAGARVLCAWAAVRSVTRVPLLTWCGDGLAFRAPALGAPCRACLRPFAACLLFPLDFTATGGVGRVAGALRAVYALYLEGAVLLAFTGVALHRADAARGLTALGLRWRLIVADHVPRLQSTTTPTITGRGRAGGRPTGATLPLDAAVRRARPVPCPGPGPGPGPHRRQRRLRGLRHQPQPHRQRQRQRRSCTL
ncbi:TWiK family of potassium channels protein 7, partial [Gryllus bimaculatus]